MKTLSTIIVVLIISLLQFGGSINGSQILASPKKITPNAIETLIMGLNSENEGLVSQCIIFAGKHRIIEAVKALEMITKSKLSFELKAAAVYALYKIHTSDALDALKNVSIENDCPFIRQTTKVFLADYPMHYSNVKSD